MTIVVALPLSPPLSPSRDRHWTANEGDLIVYPERNFEFWRGSSTLSNKNEMFCRTYLFDSSHPELPQRSNSDIDEEGDANCISKPDETEVRMDLTDDLLHMVCAICLLFKCKIHLFHLDTGCDLILKFMFS